MKLAILSATKVSIEPIEYAFLQIDPNIEFFHLLDTSLLPMLKSEKGITPKIIQRFTKLIDLAVSADAKAVLFTCSAFNDITMILQPLYEIKLFRSDEAMLTQATKYQKIGLVSTVAETSLVLEAYLKKLKPEIKIESAADDGIIHLLERGKKEEHDERVRKMINQLKGKVEVIILSQYSIAHVKEQVSLDIPILTAPAASAKQCVEYLRKLADNEV